MSHWITNPDHLQFVGMVKKPILIEQLDANREPFLGGYPLTWWETYFRLDLTSTLNHPEWALLTHTSTIYETASRKYKVQIWVPDDYPANVNQLQIIRTADNYLVGNCYCGPIIDPPNIRPNNYLCFVPLIDLDSNQITFMTFYDYYYNSEHLFGSDNANNFDATEFQKFLDDAYVEEDEPYVMSDDNEDDSGYGDFDYSGDDDDFTSLPTISASGTGLCNLFKLSHSDIADLASYLWGLGSIASFLPVFSNPMDCILSLGIVPVDPSAGARDYIKVGNLTTTAQGAPISNQFIAQDMGKVTIGKGKFSNSFMDYSPYTKAELYLPYIGTVTLDIDEIMDSTLYLNYNIDLLSGAAVAELKVIKNYKYKGESHTHTNILYSYSGNVLTNVPITGQNFTQMFQAIVGAVATGIGGNASGAMAKNPTMQNAIQQQTVASEISSSSAMKPDIKRGGNIASSCGMMSKQKAKVILSLPKLCMTDKQGQEVGYPRYNRYQLKNLKGYTKIFEIHLSGIPCTDTERKQIQSVLTGGVIISKTAAPTQTAGNNTVLIYSQKCEDIELNKADNWTLLDTITGSWKSDTIDILAPKIRLEATSNLTYAKIMQKANYVYIGDFKRYYYITKITAMSGNIFELELSVDAPMSWLTEVLNQYAIVDRQQNSWNVYLSDSFIRTYNTPYNTVLEFDKGFTTHNFVLAVAGG